MTHEGDYNVSGHDIPPVFAVSEAVFKRGIVEAIFTIEAAGTLRESSVELVHCRFVSSFQVLHACLVLKWGRYDYLSSRS